MHRYSTAAAWFTGGLTVGADRRPRHRVDAAGRREAESEAADGGRPPAATGSSAKFAFSYTLVVFH